MSKNALQHLTELDYAVKRAAHPTVPYLPRTKFSDKTANGLTKCIVRCFELHNCFASRIASTGSFRADLDKWIPSQQKAGMPDVYAVVNSRSVHVEVKAGKDRLSAVQRTTITALEKSGSLVYVAHSYADFWAWFGANFPAIIQH